MIEQRQRGSGRKPEPRRELEQAPDLRRDDMEASGQRQDRRRAEHGQRLQDGDQRAGQHCRQHSGNGDFAQRRHRFAAKDGRSVLEIRRDLVERIGDQREDIRESEAGDGEDQPTEGVDSRPDTADGSRPKTLR